MKQKAQIKGQEIAKLGAIQKTSARGLEIEIVEMNPLEDGVEVYAKAWENGEQIGFGNGTIDIERFLVHNPPIMVWDGTYHEECDDFGCAQIKNFREDLKSAIVNHIARVIKSGIPNDYKHNSSKIVQGKRGSTTSTFTPDADPESTSVDGSIANTESPSCGSESWATVHDDTDGSAASDNSATG
ncbi:MAG: hypothetical protein GTO02_04355, partial [Candidatus Dadabacteria bacterium]|nr:hypothetical protein [Candidatus Dadabacteria bacterium]